MQKRSEAAAHRKKIIEMSRESLEKIKKHHKTIIIEYPKYKEAYDYVAESFPNIDIKEIKIYQCDVNYLKRLGFSMAKGFYLIYDKAIVIASNCEDVCEKDKCHYDEIEMDDKDVKAKYTTDEVLIHEMLHYVSNALSPTSTELFEEEFAYGNSVEYFIKKGYTIDDIIFQKLIIYLHMAIKSEKKILGIIVKSLEEQGYNVQEFNNFSIDKRKRILKKISSVLQNNLKKEIYDLGKRFIEVHKKYQKNDNVDVEDDIKPFDTIDL
jgi:hypothetical protein